EKCARKLAFFALPFFGAASIAWRFGRGKAAREPHWSHGLSSWSMSRDDWWSDGQRCACTLAAAGGTNGKFQWRAASDWLGNLDSNQDKQSQSPLSHVEIIGEFDAMLRLCRASCMLPAIPS